MKNLLIIGASIISYLGKNSWVVLPIADDIIGYNNVDGGVILNFLDAHKIINKYIDTLAVEVPKGTVYRRISELQNSKEDIYIAYKIFAAHMLAFNTRTPDFFEQLNSSLLFMDMFAEDEIVNQIEECQRILNAKGIFGRIKNKSAKPLAEEKLTYLMKQVPVGQSIERQENIDKYLQNIQKEVKLLRARLSEIPKDDPKRAGHIMIEINRYCEQVYSLAGLDMAEDDIEYFYPFGILRMLFQYPNLAEFYAPYKDYIFENE